MPTVYIIPAYICIRMVVFSSFIVKMLDVKFKSVNLIYPTHFEDVQCQSGVNHIYES